MKILSSKKNLEFFPDSLSEQQIISVNSDLKHRIFPRPFERLSRLRGQRDLVGIEIGVAGGEHALSLLENLDIERLYLVDPYEMYDRYIEGEGQNFGTSQLPLSDTFDAAQELLMPYRDKITFVKKLSADAVDDCCVDADFIYIDGNHDYSFVKDDLESYYPILRSGGVLGGHDFYNGFAKSHDGVLTAVAQFVVERDLQLYVEQPDFWFYKP